MRGRRATTLALLCAAVLGTPGTSRADETICVTVVVSGAVQLAPGPTCVTVPLLPFTSVHHYQDVPVAGLLTVDVDYYGP